MLEPLFCLVIISNISCNGICYMITFWFEQFVFCSGIKHCNINIHFPQRGILHVSKIFKNENCIVA